MIASVASTRGKHNLTFGFEFQKVFMNEGQPVSPSGWYTFDNTATSSTTFAGNGSDFAGLLLGMGSAPAMKAVTLPKTSSAHSPILTTRSTSRTTIT